MKKSFRHTLLPALLALFSCTAVVDDKGDKPTVDSTGSPVAGVTEVTDTVDVRMAFVQETGILIQELSEKSQSEADLVRDSASSGFERLVFLGSQSQEAGIAGKYSTVADNSFRNGSFRLLTCNRDKAGQAFRMTIQIRVKDFSTWKWLFDGEEKNRINAGMTLLQLGYASDDANSVFIMFAIPDIAKAREMLAEPGIDERMVQSGVVGRAIACFWRPALRP
jgi:hypothetical protein